MDQSIIPVKTPNWLDGREVFSVSGETFNKINPANGQVLCKVARSTAEDIDIAVNSAKRAYPVWADTPPVQRAITLCIDRGIDLSPAVA